MRESFKELDLRDSLSEVAGFQVRKNPKIGYTVYLTYKSTRKGKEHFPAWVSGQGWFAWTYYKAVLKGDKEVARRLKAGKRQYGWEFKA